MPATPRDVRLVEEGGLLWQDEKALRVFQLEDMSALPPPEWLIQNFVERYGLTQVAGREKTGKSTFVLDILLSWLTGAETAFVGDEDAFKFLAAPSDHKVLYCLLEGQNSVYYRAMAWATAHGVDLPENFYIMPDSLSLHQPGMKADDPTTWSLTAKRLLHTIEVLKPTILVVDTFSRSTPGIDENSSQMANVVGIFDYLRDHYGLTTVVVHHTAKAQGSISRGHSSLQDAQNVHITLDRKEEHDHRKGITVTMGPNRNSGMEGVRPYVLQFTENPKYNAAYFTRDDNVAPDNPAKARLFELMDAGAVEGSLRKWETRLKLEGFDVSHSTIGTWLRSRE